jgi:hypothetical protein
MFISMLDIFRAFAKIRALLNCVAGGEGKIYLNPK